MWDGVYAGQISVLESLAIIESDAQFFEDNGVFLSKGDLVPEDSEIFELLEDEYDDVFRVKVISQAEEWEVEVINLGLDDEDDREVELLSTMRFKVYFDGDLDDWDKTEMTFSSVVTSDDDVLEAEVTYSL